MPANIDGEISEAGPARRATRLARRKIRAMAARNTSVLDRHQGRADPDRASIRAELARLESLLQHRETVHGGDIASVHVDHRQDAINLVHYLTLRHQDVRQLQRALGERGLSSLGRCEPHVLATVESVRAALDGRVPRLEPSTLSFEEGRNALDRNTDALFGPRPPERVPRIMVTLPTEAADDYLLVRHLVARGMDVARINGAHDDPDRWERMARNVHKASTEIGHRCRVSIDLPGPKMRTGPLVKGPRVVKLRPRRDLRGVPMAPAFATLVPSSTPFHQAQALGVDPSWIERRHVGEVVHLADTRGSPRELRVVEATPGRCVVEIWDTTYIETGTTLTCDSDMTRVGALVAHPPVPRATRRRSARPHR